MGAETFLGPAASVAGGLLGASSASDAADAQAAATREANATQRYIYDDTVKRNQPAMDAGNTARNKLMQLLGLGGTPGGTATGPTREQLRQQLIGQYTTQAPAAPQVPVYGGGGREGGGVDISQFLPQGSTVDENALQRAIDAQYQPGGGIDSNSADYGSLLKQFTGADLQNEPGYQFGLQQGNQALDRKAAAGGGYFSGAALKAAQTFGQDYAGTKFNEAFNRDTTGKNNIYNRLQGIVSPGQVATSQVGAAGQNYANTVGNNLTANGTAQGAAGIAGANALGGGLTGAYNTYQNTNLMNSLMKNLNRGQTPPIYDAGFTDPW